MEAATISPSFTPPSQSPNPQQKPFRIQNDIDFNSIFPHFFSLLPVQIPSPQAAPTTPTTGSSLYFSWLPLSTRAQQNSEGPTKPTSKVRLEPSPNSHFPPSAPAKCVVVHTTSIPIDSSSHLAGAETQDIPTKPISHNFLNPPLLPFPTKFQEENTTSPFNPFNLFCDALPIGIQRHPQGSGKHAPKKILKLPLLPFLNIFSSQRPSTKRKKHQLNFSSTSLSIESRPEMLLKQPSASKTGIKMQSQALLKSLSVFEKSVIGAMAGGIAGAFTYVCLLPLDTVKTKLQTKGASQIYNSAFDAVVKTFQSKGILGFYSGISAVIVGSTFSSAVYFGTCEFGKSVLAKLPSYPPLLIPPTAGAMGNIVSSAIMVPKELITQRMQVGSATGRSWQVLLKILEKDGILGLYAGYSATLLRNLPAGVLSYSSFEYLKAAVLRTAGKSHLEPIQSVLCGALAGAISASLTTPLDVVKTRLMTQGDVAKGKIAASVYGGISTTVKQILKEEGWVGLTRGMGPRVLHSACFAALGYFAFETARLMLLHQYVQQHRETETAC
ncbi:Protein MITOFERRINLIKE 1, chloroplastic [Asimina triloba]